MKKLVAVLAGLLIAAMAFAYDGTLVGGADGTFSRADWKEAVSDPSVGRDVLDQSFSEYDNVTVNKYFQVTDDNADEEDLQVISDLEEYITSEYGLKNKTGYSHLIFRSVSDNSVDGWLIFSHYSKSNGFLHYVYYFSVDVQ